MNEPRFETHEQWRATSLRYHARLVVMATPSDGVCRMAGRGEPAMEADLFFLSIPLEHTTARHRITNATEPKLFKLKTLYTHIKGVGV
jgi:hypothetical protein